MTLKEVVKNSLCLGCGFCALNPYSGLTVNMVFDKNLGHYVPSYTEESKNSEFGASICPGVGYKIKTEAEIAGNSGQYSIDLGYINRAGLCTVNNEIIEANGSSTGAVIVLANELIERGMVDGFVVTKFIYTINGPEAVAYIARNLSQLQESQGSKYCPVDLTVALRSLKFNSGSNYGFIGTPCQIAAARKIQKSGIDLGLRYFLGIFCGGIKSNKNINRLIELTGNLPSEVTEFRFREGGQPGSMLVKTNASQSRIAYPEYVKMTGYSKLKRCHFCVDATAELADVSFGDAWIPRIQNMGLRASIVLVRNERLENIIKELNSKSSIEWLETNTKEIRIAQDGNLETKKYRQRGRLLLYRILGHSLPTIDEGFHKDVRHKIFLETRVWLSHKCKQLAEKMGLFQGIYYRNKSVHRILVKIFSDIYN